MQWRDTGIVLNARRHGESAAILDAFTREHGRHLGVVRGGMGRRLGPMLQPGGQLDLTWRARLEDQMGHFTVEPIRSRTAQAISDRTALLGLNAVTALLSFCLAERDPHPGFYEDTEFLLDLLDTPEVLPLAYVRWEQQLLEITGFGLDLSQCAVTGGLQELVFVSPRTGRAVSRQGAGEWADKLLPLSPVLRGVGSGTAAEVADALQTTGHFLTHHLAPSLGGRPLPAARERFLNVVTRGL